MKRRKTDGLWYNARSKELDGILLESRLAAARQAGPCPDARTGLRMMGVYPGVPTTIF